MSKLKANLDLRFHPLMNELQGKKYKAKGKGTNTSDHNCI